MIRLGYSLVNCGSEKSTGRVYISGDRKFCNGRLFAGTGAHGTFVQVDESCGG